MMYDYEATERKSIRMSVSVYPSLFTQWKSYCKTRRISMSDTICIAMAEYLQNHFEKELP